MSKLYTVSFCFVAEQDAIVMEFLLRLLEKQTGHEWQVAEESVADLSIIDIDENNGMTLYTKEINNSGKPIAIALSENTPAVATEFLLSKPIRSVDYLDLLKSVIDKHPELGQDEDSNNEEPAPSINKNTVETVQVETKQPAEQITVPIKRSQVKKLYHLLTEGTLSNKQAYMLSFQEISFYIDFASNNFFCEHRLILLSMFCKTNIDNIQVTEISNDTFSKIKNDLSAQPLSELIWHSTLLGSSGELRDKFNEVSKVHLKRWPGLVSQTDIPKHITRCFIRLAAFMTKNAATLNEIATKTNVKPENIISFVNACSFLDLIDDGTATTHSVTSSTNTEAIKKGLFGKLRNKLGMKSA